MILHNFISLRVFIVYMENSLRFEFYFGQIHRSEICTEVSFALPKLMWTQIILHRTETLPQSEISNRFEFTSGLV